MSVNQTSKNIYIAGPMRGYPEFNRQAFDDAVERWRVFGWHVTSPANIDRAMTGDPDIFKTELPNNPTFVRRALLIDCTVICHADAVALLPGWERSVGCTVELALAQLLKLDIYDAVTMQPKNPEPLPWNLVQEYREKF